MCTCKEWWYLRVTCSIRPFVIDTASVEVGDDAEDEDGNLGNDKPTRGSFRNITLGTCFVFSNFFGKSSWAFCEEVRVICLLLFVSVELIAKITWLATDTSLIPLRLARLVLSRSIFFLYCCNKKVFRPITMGDEPQSMESTNVLHYWSNSCNHHNRILKDSDSGIWTGVVIWWVIVFKSTLEVTKWRK